MIGQKIAQYRIVEKLGGGMGWVYLAEDETLGRQVVLKLVDIEHFAGDSRGRGDARSRLVREARAASSLDHPNICTIYGVGETENGRLYIAMPYYAGETLEQRLARSLPEITEAIDLLTQAALGLGKAHRHGIVHRDVKPRNMVITPEGRLKVLDFGLAKGLDDDSVTGEILIGTPVYLAPERMLHERLEPTADQWSLAVIAYEMFTGRLPFARTGGAAHLLRSISEDDPLPPSEVRPELPAAFDRALARALDKDPKRRFDDVLDFANAVREAFGLVPAVREPHESWPGVQRTEVLDRALRGKQRSGSGWGLLTLAGGMLASLGAATMLAIVIFGWLVVDRWGAGPFDLGLTSTRPLTHEVGLEKNPRFSPDGRWLVYVSDQNGNMDIWIRQIDSGATAPLTADHPGYDDHPIFSPDGRHVVFVSDRGGGGVFYVPMGGGEPRRLLPFRLHAGNDSKLRAPSLAFAPDGRTLAIGGTSSVPGLFLLSVDSPAWGEPGGGSARDEGGFAGSPGSVDDGEVAPGTLRTLKVDRSGALSLGQPAFSPDGRWLAYVTLSGTGTTSARLWLLSMAGRRLSNDGSRTDDAEKVEPLPLTEGLHQDFQPAFSRDGRRLFFVSDRGGVRDLWWIPLGSDGLPSGPARALSAGIDLASFALDPTGDLVAYSKVEERANIWRMPVLDRPVRLDDARAVTSERNLVEMISISPDGRLLAFDSNRSGNADLWLLDMEDGELRQLTTDPAHDWCPRFSPDGRQLAFYSLRQGSRDVYLMSADGGPSRVLAASEGRDWMPFWAPSGDFLVFESDRGAGERNIWRVGVDGGEPVRLTADDGTPEMYPVISPDGRRVVYTRHEGNHMRLMILPLGSEPGAEPGAGARTLTRSPWPYLFAYAWEAEAGERDSGADSVIYAQGRRNAGDPLVIWEIDPETGEARALSDFRSGSMEIMESLAVHDRQLYFPLWELRGDLWLAVLEDIDGSARHRSGR